MLWRFLALRHPLPGDGSSPAGEGAREVTQPNLTVLTSDCTRVPVAARRSGQRWRNRLRRAAQVGLTCLFAGLTGCQLLHSPAVWKREKVVSEPVAKQMQILQTQFWQRDLHWSPLSEHTGCRQAGLFTVDWRWKLPAARDLEQQLKDGESELLAELLAGPRDVAASTAVLWVRTAPQTAWSSEQLHWLGEIAGGSNSSPSASLAGNLFAKAFVGAAATAKSDAHPKAESDRSAEFEKRLSAAAAEAWCRALSLRPESDELRWKQAVELTQNRLLPAEVRNEIWLGMSRKLPPDRLPTLGWSTFDWHAAEDRPTHLAQLELRLEIALLYAVHHPRVPPDSAARATDSTAPDPSESRPVSNAVEEWEQPLLKMPRLTSPRANALQLYLAALRDWPVVQDWCLADLRAAEIAVREPAALALGLWGTPSGLAELKKLEQKSDDPSRILALKGLAITAEFDPQKFVLGSAAIRQELARSLRGRPAWIVAPVMKRLLSDETPGVQTAAMESLIRWPDELAEPLLVQALADSQLSVRKQAVADLERRWKRRVSFPVDAVASVRAEAAEVLARGHQLPDALTKELSALADRNSQPAHQQRRTELWNWLSERRRQIDALSSPPAAELAATDPAAGGKSPPATTTAATTPALSTPAASNPAAADTPRTSELTAAEQEWIKSLTASDVPLLEQMSIQLTSPDQEFLRAEVLPEISPVYRAVQSLQQADLSQRRQAATELVRLSREQSLAPNALTGLATTLRKEQDQQVWRLVMESLQADSSPEAMRVAELAVHHQWPDIRVIGLRYVARHGGAEQAAWLLPLLTDSHETVRHAAILAARQCRNPLVLDGTRSEMGETIYPGLRPLLATEAGNRRWDLLLTMAQLGDSSAASELERLARDPQPVHRTKALRAMGETGQSRFIETALTVLWTEQDRRVIDAGLECLTKLVPADSQPRSAAGLTVAEKVAAWMNWKAEQKPRGESSSTLARP